jgi:predicted amino acid-binding ACT domain protein
MLSSNVNECKPLTPGVSAQLFEALASANCNVKAISQAGGLFVKVCTELMNLSES